MDAGFHIDPPGLADAPVVIEARQLEHPEKHWPPFSWHDVRLIVGGTLYMGRLMASRRPLECSGCFRGSDDGRRPPPLHRRRDHPLKGVMEAPWEASRLA